MIIKLLLKYISDLKIVLVAVLFYLAAWMGYSLAFEHATSLPFWPPSGIAFALIILLGRQAWPGVVIGTLLANTMGVWNTPSLSVQSSVTIAVFIALGNTMEVLFGNYLIKHWVKDDYPFRNTMDAFRFLFITLVMCLVGAMVGVSGLQLIGSVAAEGFLRASFSWWIESVVGILLFTPFVLSVARKYKFTFSVKNALEVGVFLSFLSGLYFLFQIEYIHDTLERALPFLILPFLLWLAFRFELIASISAVMLVSLLAIYFTIHGMGPFVLMD